MSTIKLRRTVERIAARYARRCWWADERDLRQEGWRAALEATRTFDPSEGVPLEGYCGRAAVYAMRELLWRASAPVSASDHALKHLAGLHHAPLSDARDEPAREAWADELLDDKGWRERVRRRLLGAAGDDPMGLLGLECLLSEMKPGEFATMRGIPVSKVYRAVAALKERCASSLDLYRLWEERA